MWLIQFCALLAISAASRTTFDSIGYFWHITDFHYDAHFSQTGDAKKGCWRPDYESGSRGSRKPAGRYGDHSCDAPWELIESAVRTMMSRQGDNIEFVLWTGDALSRATKPPATEPHQLDLLKNLTDLIMKTFRSHFVFPALGHDDPKSIKDLSQLFRRWLPSDSLTTFESGGYYMIERKSLLQIVVLNTNLMKGGENEEEARRQWDWLNSVLYKIQFNKKTAYIVGHMPPGSDERQRGAFQPNHVAYSGHNNKRYLKLIRKYADIIVGQFFGHLHSDSFRVVYNEHGRPVSWLMLTPAVTPRRTTDGPNNPGLRLYKFNKDTGQVVDYIQYYLDLAHSNSNSKSEAEWNVEYTFSSYYGISNITPLSLHNLAEKLTQSNTPDNSVFNKYYKANSVRMYSLGCDSNCAHNHYCAITRIDYEEYEHCLKTAASALASSSSSSFIMKGCLYFITILFMIVREV